MNKSIVDFTPRGLRRVQAAVYLGISPSKFDQGRKDGKISPPKNFLRVALYCRHELDAMFDDLSAVANDNDNEWNSVLPGGDVS